jgi:sugar phosphate isomerase/epimerase
VPPPAPAGNPELFLLGSTDAVERRLACMLLLRTLDLAVSVGAEAVVAHAARARMPDLTRRVADRLRSGRPPGWWARFTERRLKARRDAEAPRCLDALRRSLAEVLPAFDRAGVALCLENLPSWEGVPNETEMFDLANEFGTPALGYWHDIGHGQVRENLGIAPHRAWAERLLPFTRGIHIHDVRPPDADHLVPPSGGVPFAAFAFYAVDGLLRVFEPGPAATAEELVKGLAHVRKAWSRAPAAAVGGDGPLAAAR